MSNTTCQKEASTLAGRLLVLGTGYAWNLSKPDIETGAMLTITNINRRMAGGAILTFPKALSAVGNAYRVCSAVVVGFLESIKKGGISATLGCVGQSAILHFGHSFGFLRCSSLSFRPQASSTQDEKLAPGFSSFSRSTLASISAMSSCGKRIAFLSDLLFLFPVAIAGAHILLRSGYTPYNKKTLSKTIDVGAHQNVRWSHTLSTGKAQATHKIAKPAGATNTNGPLTTTDSIIIEAAMQNHTTPLTGRNSLTPNKFTWRFLAVSRSDRNAKPCRMSVEAHTEREARQELAPHFILSLAARLPIPEVSHV